MALKLAMHNWMRPEPIETTAARLARSGYQGIEISGEPAQYDAVQVKALLDRHGLRCWGSVTLMTTGRDLISEDHYVRLGSIQYVKDCLSLAASLGGQIVTVIPSTVGKTAPMSTVENEWGWAVEALKECQEHAEKVGVRIAIEPLNRFETYFINRHDQALELAGQVGGNCGVCLDFFHMNIEEEDWERALRDTQATGKLYDIHIADNNRMPPGQGSIDWAKAVSVVQDMGYDGYLTVEFVVNVDRTPRSTRTEIADATEAEATEGLIKFLRDHGTGTVPEHYYDRYVQESADHLRESEKRLAAPRA
ncbi:MAG: sugar phosphate isomerase/epimerase [Candidatus Dormibacteraeota bacterium]|nr:sugar phosphate isomerase/epimerase [Candidatus Dormibacteraeota bacterium]